MESHIPSMAKLVNISFPDCKQLTKRPFSLGLTSTSRHRTSLEIVNRCVRGTLALPTPWCFWMAVESSGPDFTLRTAITFIRIRLLLRPPRHGRKQITIRRDVSRVMHCTGKGRHESRFTNLCIGDPFLCGLLVRWTFQASTWWT